MVDGFEYFFVLVMCWVVVLKFGCFVFVGGGVGGCEGVVFGVVF